MRHCRLRRVILTSHEGDPVLARWHYGLGRAVSWTSDVKGRWAEHWVNWSAFPQFLGKVINWTLPEGIEESGEVVPKASEKNLEENPEGGFSARLLAAKKRCRYERSEGIGFVV